MKILFTLTIFAICSIVNATDYYISSTGDDQKNTGLSEASPWKTIEKVNSIFSSLKPGDRVLFKRGDKFFGTIIITKSGSDGLPITIGAYGSGEKPVITGFKRATNWNSEENGIYSATASSEEQTNMVCVNGKQVPMGRYPDSGSNLVFESFKTNPCNIGCAGLGNAINWTGAEAVINVNDWSLDRCLVKSHSGNVINYTNLGSEETPTCSGRYFFIQNHLRCLTTDNEWYHSVSDNKFYIYGNPSDKTIDIAYLDYLIYNQGYNYINIDGLTLSGAIIFSIYMTNGNTNCTIKNSIISFAGESGIRCNGGNYHTYDNNIFSDINRAALYLTNCRNFKITNNTIKDIGIVPGGSFRATQNNGMFLSVLSNSTVQYNNISNVGYNGIYITGSNTEIKNNFINYACMLLNDGAAIYTSGVSNGGLIFDGNIILNSGVGNINAKLAEGIYLDENSANITVANNTVANCLFAGIKNHKGNNNKIISNTAFNNNSGIYIQNSSSKANVIKNLKINNNILVAKDYKQISLRFHSQADDIPGFGNADNNYYARPVDNCDAIYISSPSTGSKYRSLAEWRTFTGQDLNSQGSTFMVSDTSDIYLYFNASKSSKTISLPEQMIDITGVKYPNMVSVQPYASIILFKDPDAAKSAIPELISSVIENAAPATLVMTFNVYLSGISPSPSAFSLNVNGAIVKINSVSVSGNKVSLVLADRVNYGENVTVTYTKPTNNSLQSTAGISALSFNSQPVNNNCVNPLNKPPLVSISSASKGNSFQAPASVTVEIKATDPDGTITKVELYNGNEKICEMTTNPYVYTLKNLTEGSYSLKAVATDDMESASVSDIYKFMVTKYDKNYEHFNIYPNPSDGYFSIDLQSPQSTENFSIIIVNLAGKIVYQRILSGEPDSTRFDLSYLNPGTYIVMIKNKLIIATQKLIKT